MKIFRKKATKILACVLAAALLCGCTGVLAYTAGSKKTSSAQTDTSLSNPETTAASSTFSAADGDTISKDETVYVMADATGNPNKVIVSDWIRNGAKADSVTDSSTLSDIQNVEGDETYTINKDNMIVWDAQGNDIYYQGTAADMTLPVDVAVSYQLDGKTISPDDLAGKSGKVTVRFTYTNNESENVQIDGKTTAIKVPFIMLTGLILDNDNFSNISVTNGKIINDGTRSYVIGLALPGLQDDLGVSSNDLDLPDSVEITADASDFELSTTITLATNSVFNELNSTKLANLDNLQNDADQLTNAMSHLMDGSSQLYDGLSSLLDSSNELVSGINQLAAGAKTLESGAGQVSDGAAELESKMSELESGLQTLVSKNDELNGGAETVFNTLLSTANTQLTSQLKDLNVTVPTLTMDNYDTVLSSLASNMSGDTAHQTAYNLVLQTVTATVQSSADTIRTAVTAQVQANVLQNILSSQGLSMDQYNGSADVKAAVDAAVAQYMASSDGQSAVESNTQAQIQAQIDNAMKSDDALANISAIETKLNAGADSINALKAELDNYNTFYQGVQEYTSGVQAAYAGSEQLYAGSSDLSSGASQVASGSSTLSTGLNTLKSNVGSLPSGVSQLENGSMQLSTGLKELDEQGIQKITDLFSGNLGTLSARLQAIADVSKDYNSYSGIADGMDGQVKFVYETDAISSDTSDTSQG